MGTLLRTLDADEALAERKEDLHNRAAIMVKMGLVDYHFDNYEVLALGFARGSFIVTADGGCSCGEPAPCVHREAVRLFVQGPSKPSPTPARRVEDPQGPNVAKTMAELVTPRQLKAIRIKCASRGINAETESVRLFQCRPERLTKRAAHTFINHLERIKR